MKLTALVAVAGFAALCFTSAACSKKDSKPAAPSCAQAMKGMKEGYTRMAAGFEMPELMTKMMAILATKCEAKQWPAGMIECYSRAVGDDSKPEEVSKADHCQMEHAAFINEVAVEASK